MMSQRAPHVNQADIRLNEDRLLIWSAQRLDEAFVVALRGYAAQLWDRYPEMSVDSVKHTMSDHAERINATSRELRVATFNLHFVREDTPAPITLRSTDTPPLRCNEVACKHYPSCDRQPSGDCFELLRGEPGGGAEDDASAVCYQAEACAGEH
ncbi:MAG: hypothetical protein ABFD89_17445 [Bryobacteraceae bacterium]